MHDRDLPYDVTSSHLALAAQDAKSGLVAETMLREYERNAELNAL